ncbi:MAG: ribonuclease P protein component [Solirubrobacterales bacterium]|nr:ribonuclease P protein component [Solirubrobacterales bacterium]
MPSQCFSKVRRLRRRGEFKRVFDLALRTHGRFLSVLMAPNEMGASRLGIVASRKLGDAVRRNRAKRLIREVFRKSSPLLFKSAVDLVVIPRRELFDATYPSLENDFLSAVKRCVARLPADGTR